MRWFGRVSLVFNSVLHKIKMTRESPESIKRLFQPWLKSAFFVIITNAKLDAANWEINWTRINIWSDLLIGFKTIMRTQDSNVSDTTPIFTQKYIYILSILWKIIVFELRSSADPQVCILISNFGDPTLKFVFSFQNLA